MAKLDLTVMFFVDFRADYRMRLFRMNSTEMNVGPWQICLRTQLKELKTGERQWKNYMRG